MSSKKQSGWLKWVILLALLAGAGAGGYWYTQRGNDDAPNYRFTAVDRSNLVQSVTATGALNPVTNVQVGSQISGILQKINVDFNSRVQKDDIIAQIDPATYRANVTQAEGELMNAQASLEFADINFRRAKTLLESKLIPLTDYEKAVADQHQAQAIVKIREAALEKAKIDLARTTITAPISGMVISRNIDVGQTVAASFNTPTLFLIANDLSKMQIEALVSEADVGGIEERQPVTFNVDAFPSRAFKGQVKQVRFAPITNQNVVTYDTVIEVDNADLKLRPGMTANVKIITAERQNALRVPNAALRFRPPESAASNKKPTTSAAGKSSGGTNASTIGTNAAVVAAAPSASEDLSALSPEERRRRLDSMTPEQRQEVRARMRARFGEGGPPGAGGDRPRAKPEGPTTATLYLMANTNAPLAQTKPDIRPVTVKLGISDGAFTEVLDGLKEGDLVITGLVMPEASAAGARPQTSPFGGGPRRF